MERNFLRLLLARELALATARQSRQVNISPTYFLLQLRHDLCVPAVPLSSGVAIRQTSQAFNLSPRGRVSLPGSSILVHQAHSH